MKRQKRYIKRDDLESATHLEINVYYCKGIVSHLTGQSTTRGYYISVLPVTLLKNDMVSYVLFTGRGQLLLETNRYSEKQFARAIEMAAAFEDELIAAVVTENKAK